MGFMKSVGKAIAGPIGQAAASLIPGVGPLVSAGLGMAGSALGASGAQGGSQTSSQWGQSGTTSQNTSGAFNRQEQGTQNVIEDPLGAAFRQSLIPQMAKITAAAEEPVYGEAEKAGFINNLNDLTKDAMASLRSNLAATGRLDSGGLDLAAGNLEMGRLGEIAKYQSQIPLLNRQYKDQALERAMTLSQGLVPLNRLGQTSSATSSGTESQQSTGTNQMSGTSQGTQTVQGPSFWKNLATGFGDLAGDAFSGENNPLAALFKNKTSPGGMSYTDLLPSRSWGGSTSLLPGM